MVYEDMTEAWKHDSMNGSSKLELGRGGSEFKEEEEERRRKFKEKA